MKRSNMRRMMAVGVAALLGFWSFTAHSQTVETGDEHPLYFGLGVGYLDFDGGQPLRDGCFPALHVGYDFSSRLSLDAQFRLLPNLRGQYRYEDGRKINKLWEQTGGNDGGVNDTWGYGVAVDALYHLTRWERLDPYLAAGLGYNWYKDTFYDASALVELRFGGGLMYHLNDEWAIRVDYRGYPVGNQNSFKANSEFEAGLVWTWGAHTPTKLSTVPTVVPAPVAPVTAPPAVVMVKPVLPPPADLQTFKLDLIVAKDGRWHPEYLSELDAIAKAIQSHPASGVWIEGHIDQTPALSDREARSLTAKQAETVRDYFVKNHAIAKKRLTAVGYGFSRPKAPNDPLNGNQENRRIEIHIRPPQQAP